MDDLSEAKRNEIIALGVGHRGRHDELLREFSSGQALRFDILMDIGGFRDMHRHRHCVQVLQEFTSLHGFDVPEGLAEAGLEGRYGHGRGAWSVCEAGVGHPESAQYALPLGTRNRALFKMDFAEALYFGAAVSSSGTFFLPEDCVGDV